MPDDQGLEGQMLNPWIRHYEEDGTEWTILKNKLSFLREAIGRIKNIDGRKHFELLHRSMVRVAGKLKIYKPEGTERVFIKKYNPGDLLSALRFLILGSKARKEWTVATRLQKLEIPTSKPLAFGEKKRGPFIKESFLITEDISEAISLDRYLKELKGGKPDLFSSKFYKILYKLASIVGNMHLKGIYHQDLHAGNVLISDNGKDGFSLYIIDLHRTKVIKKISRKRRLFNLAQLFLSLDEMMRKEEKVHFLARYVEIQQDPLWLWKMDDVIKKIDLLMERIRFRHYWSRQRRCLKRSTLFDRDVKNGYQWYWRRGSPVEEIEKILENMRSGRHSPERILKASRDSVVSLWPAKIDQRLKRVCVKTYRYRGIIRTLRSLFRPSKAMRSWISSHGLSVRGILTADNLALIEKRKWGCLRESFLFMEDLSDWIGIDNYIKGAFSKKGNIKEKMAFIEAFANAMRSVHDRGVYHRDLKASNILVNEKGNGNWFFSFIDLDGLKFKNRSIGNSKRIFNLAQINASIPSQMSSTDRLRFLLDYSEEERLTKWLKSFAHKVISKSKERAGAWPHARPHPFK